MKQTARFYDFGNTAEQVIKEAKKQGYKYCFIWVNSDYHWYFLQTTFLKAEKAAIRLYMEQRGNRLGITKEEAKKYYSEFIDIIPIQDIT